MSQNEGYHDIALRTAGEMFIGVVGPGRTGKSTLIRRIMDTLVLTSLEDAQQKQRLTDELPQSGSGRTIMTTQMQFVLSEPLQIDLGGVPARLRLVDCVGYMVEGALGTAEGDAPRMVRTPWFDHEIPFSQAAEIGTRKVIADHSHLGLVVTTDGSITDLPRSAYAPAEERVVRELQELGKPFALVLNSKVPESSAARQLADTLSERYNAPVVPLNVLSLDEAGLRKLLQTVLYEFPLTQLSFTLPDWMNALPRNHWVWESLRVTAQKGSEGMTRLRDLPAMEAAFGENEYFTAAETRLSDPASGEADCKVTPPASLFYQVLSENCGAEITDDMSLMAMMQELTAAKKAYDKFAGALEQVKQTGYGLVTPSMEDMTLEKPTMVRQGGQYGVRLKASAPSWHILRVDVDTEISPTVGTEHQSEELVKYLLSGFASDTRLLWDTQIFGKSLHELVREGLNQKLVRMPADAQNKLRETIQRILNDGAGGVICIVL